MTGYTSIRCVHTLMVVPRPLRSRWIQKKRAHMFRDARIQVRRISRIFNTALRRAGRRASPRAFVPLPYRVFVRHLHNHGVQFYYRTLHTRKT